MKKIFTIVTYAITGLALAQVGINNADPKATLDIKAKTNDGSRPEGVLMPRLTATEVKTMTETSDVIGVDQEGLIVYIKNALVETERTGKYELIDSKGYYYYDSADSKWRKLLDTTNESTGLERITENGKTGWRFIGATSSAYNGIGQFATDLSYNPATSEELAKTYETDIFFSGTPDSETYENLKQRLTSINFSDLGASGANSFSAGLWNSAKGASSVALGAGNVAKGDYSYVFGVSSSTSGPYSMALGNEVKTGIESYAIGSKLDIGEYSFGFGSRLKVRGESNIALGNNSEINDGGYSISLGTNNIINPDKVNTLQNVTLIGNINKAYGNATSAFGYRLKVYSEHSTAFGIYNTEEENPELIGYRNKNKRLLVLGNGDKIGPQDTDIQRSDAFTILRNAKVGIDIDNFETIYTNNISIGHIDDAKLQVNGLIQSRGVLEADGTAATKIVVADDNGVLKTVERSTVQGETYSAGTGMSLNDNIFSRTGLEEVTEGTSGNEKTGWRLIGQNPDNYEGIGHKAVDLSYPDGIFEVSPNAGASGDYSVAMGFNTFASGEIATAIGDGAKAIGIVATAMGYNTTASGDFSLATGTRTTASGDNSTAMGNNTIATSAGEISLGSYNTKEENPEPFKFSRNNHRLFVIGNGHLVNDSFGAAHTERSDAFTILRNAKVGIDIDNFETTTSDAKLQVNGDIKVGKNTADCNTNNLGTIQYRESEDAFYGCKKTGWARLDNM